MVVEDAQVDGTLPFEEVESPVLDCEDMLCIVNNIRRISRSSKKHCDYQDAAANDFGTNR